MALTGHVPSQRTIGKFVQGRLSDCKRKTLTICPPQSALSEFLRSRGIRIQNQAAGRRNANQNNDAPVTPQDNATAQDASTEEEQQAAAQLQGGGELEGDAEVAAELAEELEAAPRKRKRASTAKNAKKKKKQEDSDSDPDYDDAGPGRSSYRREAVAPGQIDFCARCNCRFTVTIYNKPSDDGQGMLCSACATVDNNKSATPRGGEANKSKAMAKKKRNKLILDNEVNLVPTLQSVAIRAIAAHIDDVEALGDIGHVNMDKICQIISRARRLHDDTLPLFLDAGLTSLTLYDAAKITPAKYHRIAQECPHLQELDLRMCGGIGDEHVKFIAYHLRNLTSLSLRGAFLVTIRGWCETFELLGGRLEKFATSDSMRWDVASSAALAANCPNLRSLSLARLTHLDDSCIAQFTTLTALRHVDLSHAGGVVTDASIIALLSQIGTCLQSLDLSGLRDLTDAVLTDGILIHCKHLQSLKLDGLDLLTDNGVASFFTAWHGQNPGLSELSLERCSSLGDGAISAILAHSGRSLRLLNLNSLDGLSYDCVSEVLCKTDTLPQCDCIDLSFVRVVNDNVLYKLVSNLPKLEKVLVWGDNRVTECPLPRKVLVVGRE